MRTPLDMMLEASKLTQPALIELFDLDLTGLGGDFIRFHSGMNELGQPITWRGNKYMPYPVQTTGFELSGTGTSNRPKLTASNLMGMMTGLNNSFDDLAGGIVTRIQVFVIHLDEENFIDGNPKADPEQEVISRYVIERLVSQDADSASYELALPCELDNAIVPARAISTDVCVWRYRSSECSYTGGAVADEEDKPTSDMAKDVCGKRVASCKLRFGEIGVLPYGGFPSASRL